MFENFYSLSFVCQPLALSAGAVRNPIAHLDTPLSRCLHWRFSDDKWDFSEQYTAQSTIV